VAILAADRMLSQTTSSGTVEFDPRSNKIVVLRAVDGFLMAAYSGRAYLAGMPTDSFIAQSLFAARDFSEPFMFGLVGRDHDVRVDVNGSVERLRAACSAAIARLPLHERGREPLTIAVLGWRLRRAAPWVLPFVWTLAAGATPEDFVISRGTRWRLGADLRRLVALPNVSSDRRSRLERRLDALIRTESWPEIAAALVQEIRLCADERPETVGRDCLTAIYAPVDSPPIRFGYEQDPTSPSRGEAVAYTPWLLVAPYQAFGPAELEGQAFGWSLLGTDIVTDVTGLPPRPRPDGGAGQGAQRRPSDPQRFSS
jgi:hypothetical protein